MIEEKSIRVRVFIGGMLKELYPSCPEDQALEIEGPQSVWAIIEMLGINPKIIVSAQINGQLVSKDYRIKEDTEMILLSPLAGG